MVWYLSLLTVVSVVSNSAVWWMLSERNDPRFRALHALRLIPQTAPLRLEDDNRTGFY